MIVGDFSEPESTGLRVGNFPGPDGLLRATYEVHGDLAVVGGDIVWPRSSALAIGSASAGPLRRWPGGVVPYVMNDDYPYRAQVEAGVAMWNAVSERTGVRFVKHSNEKDLIEFTDEGQCYSFLGVQGGPQKLSLSEDCLKRGHAVPAHELGHTLGLIHELQRPDRDSYIAFQWDNIVSGRDNKLIKETMAIIQGATPYSDYDIRSIMHYKATGYHSSVAIDVNKPIYKSTISGVSETEANVDHLTEGDIRGVAAMYAGYGGGAQDGGKPQEGTCAIASCSEYGMSADQCKEFQSGSFVCKGQCLEQVNGCDSPNDNNAPPEEPEFTCGDGQKVPATYRCDTEADCSDGSDEQECASSDAGTGQSDVPEPAWGTCTADGQSGECLDTATTTCYGTLHTGACGGPANIRCCT